MTSIAEPEPRELALKLLTTFHLNVPERKLIPSNGIPFSTLVDAVESQISNSGWFPGPVVKEPAGEVACLEMRDGEVWLHENHEIGVSRYSDIASHHVFNAGRG